MAPTAVVEFLSSLPGPVRAVYEAGPTGFGLARAATDRGIDVRVVAAGKVPRASGDRVKTDRRDAERLARLLAAGEVRFAFVPSVANEQFGDVIRAIEDCRGDLMRGRHRLSKLLLRCDLRWTGRGSSWTTRHMSWLRALRFDEYRHRPAVGDGLARRQHGQDPRVIEIAWRAQHRLHQRWQHLHSHRRKPAGVVAIAVARELAAFLWEAATLA
jgi:transposase